MVGDRPGFSPCGAIVGMARSSYSAPCRWYVGGPLGRIRYYRVPITNRVLDGQNAFWPATELLSDFSNVDGTGEIAGTARRWERGTNFRPDLVGEHPEGSRADFAGESVLPAVQSPEPECTFPPGPELVLLVYAAYHRGNEPLFFVNALLRFDALELMRCLTIWLRPESLDQADGDPIPSWPDSSGHDHFVQQLSAFNQPLCLLSGLGGLRSAVMRQQGFLGLVTGVLLGNVGTSYVVGVVGGSLARPTGPFLTTATLDVGGFPAQSAADVFYADTLNGGVAAHAVARGQSGVWSVRRLPGSATLSFNGLVLATIATDPDGELTILGVGPWRNSSPFDGTFTLSELLVYDCPLTDDEDAAVLAYLDAKYFQYGITTETGDPLTTEAGVTLETEGF